MNPTQAAHVARPFSLLGMSRVSDKPYFVYVLWSVSGARFYIGISDDPEHRLEQHNSGEFRSWTRRHRPWQIVHVEVYATYAEARAREIELKAQKSGTGFFRKTGLDPDRFGRGS
jgi:putative endonuclease